MELEKTIFFETISSQLNYKVNVNLKRKIHEFGSKIIKILTTEEKNMVIEHLPSILKQYQSPILVNLRQHQIKKQRVSRSIDNSLRCMARTGIGNQCSRSKLKGHEFCKSHNSSLPYGRFDGDPPVKKSSKHSSSSLELKDIPMEKYIKTIVVSIGDLEYLLDENNIIYAHDRINNIVGRRVDDTYEWY